MKYLLVMLSFACLLSLPACSPTRRTPSVVVVPVATEMPPTVTPDGHAVEVTRVVATDEPVASEPTAVPNTNELLALVNADLPPNAFEGLDVLPLYVPAGERPLWAVYTIGRRNYELDPVPSHFVALYTRENENWLALARQTLNNEELGEFGFGPDFLFERGVTQVDLDPTNIWLVVDGGAGAHGGTFQLLRFDGAALHLEKDTGNASGGVGYLEDLNSDGTPELILRLHDFYVFCYACGVRYLNFEVYDWDAASTQLQERTIQPMSLEQQGHPAYEPTNRAAALAHAGLWQDALAQIEEAERVAETAVSTDAAILEWNATLIRLYSQAYLAELNHSPYPLLTQIFYGDYAAALDTMRSYSTAQLFSATSPLVKGTMAEGNEQFLANYILQQTNAAIAVQPELAAAYYFRAWATYLNNPADPQIAADFQQAAALAPNETLFSQVALPAAQRISFAPGAISATVEGDVAAHESDDYILTALAGQTMTVDITSPNSNVLLTIVGADGIPLTNGLMSGATSWQGQLPATQDYTLRAIGTLEPANYTLTVTIK